MKKQIAMILDVPPTDVLDSDEVNEQIMEILTDNFHGLVSIDSLHINAKEMIDEARD